MSGRDNSDHNQKDQYTKEQSQKNPKPDLQSIQDCEKAQNACAWFDERDKLVQAMLNIGVQQTENTPNSELENLHI